MKSNWNPFPSGQFVRTLRVMLPVLFLLFAAPAVPALAYVDAITFGDPASETSHSFSNYFTVTVTNGNVSPAQTTRICQSVSATNIYGGSLSFNLSVDATRRNYFSLKLWGGDDTSAVSGQASDMGRLYLYVPIAQFTPGNTNNYQIGYRHEGDYACLSVTSDHPPLPGRFFYSTTLLPLWMTQGRTNLTLKVVSTGRVYPLGSSGTPATGNNYQFFMTTNSRSIYRAYTHADPILIPAGEVQGVAPAVTTRPAPGQSIMNSGGTFQSGVNNYISTVLGTTLTNLTTSEVEALALAYSISNLPAGYQQAAVVAKVMAGIDAFATNYFANPGTSVSSGGGNESWGGRFGPLGHAISLLLPQLQGSLGVTNNYGGGSMSRGQAWGQMLVASRDYGRFNRDAHNISNQGLIADQNIFMANMGLRALTNASAFSETNAERYLREAVGLSPWLGSDLTNGSSSFQHGTNYFMVTRRGLSREWGYVGNGYGEIGYYAANFYQYTTNTIFRDQAAKMVRARAPFRRPAIEISGGNYYRCMEAVGLLSWRGAGESDGDYADGMAYGDRGSWAAGMRVAGVTLDTNAVGFAKQMLADNQYFSQLISDSRYYSGGSLAANSFDGRNTVLAFADYLAVSNAPDSGVRLPMTDGQPDFAWADEEDGIVALKHGGDRLWIAPYWQAKDGTGINGIGRFHFSTTNYDQYGVLETTPQFDFSGSFYVRPNLMDKPENNFYVPSDGPTNAYAGERIPVGTTPSLATDDGPFRGKASFYAFRFGNYLIGLNMNSSRSYELNVPAEFTGGSNLVTGAGVTLPVMVGPASTVVLYLSSPTNANPVPSTPLCLNAAGDATPRIALDWNPASGATNYFVKRATVSGGPYTTITNVAGTNYSDTAVTRGATYYYVVSGTNAFGESFYNSMEAVASAGLPSPWFDVDIGAVGTSGGADYNYTGTFTVKGAGSDIGGTADVLNFAYTSMTNDGSIVARLAIQQMGSSIDKVGLMMRETTNAASKLAAVILDSQLDKARLPTRSGTGSGMVWIDGPSMTWPVLWLKLQRVGTTFTGFVATNAVNWIPVGTNSFTMNSIISVGLAVCSRTTSALDISSFDNIATATWSSPLPDAPTGLAAVAGDAQAVLSWNASTNAASYNLKRSTNSGGPYALTAAGLPSPTFTDTGLVNGTKYFYVVTSSNPVGESGNSAQASVRPVSLAAAALSLGLVGTQLQLSWPQDHTGWLLQVQTNSLNNGLGTNWTSVAGSSQTNQMSISMNSTNGSVFFRLVFP